MTIYIGGRRGVSPVGIGDEIADPLDRSEEMELWPSDSDRLH